MKYCTNCGTELKDTAKFCGKCGTKLEEMQLEQVVQTSNKQPKKKRKKLLLIVASLVLLIIGVASFVAYRYNAWFNSSEQQALRATDNNDNDTTTDILNEDTSEVNAQIETDTQEQDDLYSERNRETYYLLTSRVYNEYYYDYGYTTNWEYDEQGKLTACSENVTSVDESYSHSLAYTYNTNGQIEEILSESSSDSDTLVAKYTDGLLSQYIGNEKIEFTYDQNGNITKRERMNAYEIWDRTEYVYDDKGLLKEKTCGNDERYVYEYDENGKKVLEKHYYNFRDEEAPIVIEEYDKAGRIVAITNDVEVGTYREIGVWDDTNSEVTFTFGYGTDEMTIIIKYDENNNLISKTTFINDEIEEEIICTYEKREFLEGYEVPDLEDPRFLMF